MADSHKFEAEVSEVLRLVVNSLYTHADVFLRELVSNSSDALDKLRFESIETPELRSSDDPLKIRLIPDSEKGTLTISDNGIGMSEEELRKNLGTIARSGTKEFVQKIQEAQKAQAEGVQLIGQFGVGFYSAFLVADSVEVVSRLAGTSDSYRWCSDGQDGYTMEPTESEQSGTQVTLHIKEDKKEYLEPHRLRALVTKFSDYLGHPIELVEQKDGEPVCEVINQGSALWQRSPSEVTDEQYEAFYKHLTHDWEPALAHKHFKVEGTQMFAGLVFLPKRAPFDLFNGESKHGVRLHVKRVFVMENCEELLPRWLRFIRGVVDSEDLPLNVSREMLQDSRIVKTIRKQVVNHSLSMMESLAEDDASAYKGFWTTFGAVLKEGLHFKAEEADRIAKLLRYETSDGDGITSLADYVSRMKDGQRCIYYAAGTSAEQLANSPHLEAIRERDYEVLYMPDPVDPFAVQSLPEFDGKPLVSVMSEDLKLGDSDADEDKDDEKDSDKDDDSEILLTRVKSGLSEKVSEVRVSKRLRKSPLCLVLPEGGMEPHIERLMREQQLGLPAAKRILELNSDHAVMKSLRKLLIADASEDTVTSLIEMLYDQALIAEGSPVDDPTKFARQLTDLVTGAAGAALNSD